MDEKTTYLINLVIHAWTLKDILGCHATNPEGGHRQKGFLMIVTSPYDDRSEGLTIHEILEDRIVLLRSDQYYRNYFKQTQEPVLQGTLMEIV